MDLCFLLRSLIGQDRPLPRAWATRLMPAFERLRRESELNAALALHTPQSGPNFVAPPPRGLSQTWADDLAIIRATPLEAARHEIATNATGPSARDPRVRAVLDSTDAVSRIAEAMDQAWHELLAPDWPQLRAICERDVVHRVGVIGEHGWVTTIESLHPSIAWQAGGIEIGHFPQVGTVRLMRRRATADPFGLRREYRRPPGRPLAQDLDLSCPRHRRPVGRTGERPPTGRADRSGRPVPSPAAVGAGRPGQYQPPRPKPRHGTRRGGRPPRHPARLGAARPRPIRTVGALPAHPARRSTGRRFGLRAQISTRPGGPGSAQSPPQVREPRHHARTARTMINLTDSRCTEAGCRRRLRRPRGRRAERGGGKRAGWTPSPGFNPATEDRSLLACR